VEKRELVRELVELEKASVDNSEALMLAFARNTGMKSF
jgi:hypothetical protein